MECSIFNDDFVFLNGSIHAFPEVDENEEDTSLSTLHFF